MVFRCPIHMILIVNMILDLLGFYELLGKRGMEYEGMFTSG